MRSRSGRWQQCQLLNLRFVVCLLALRKGKTNKTLHYWQTKNRRETEMRGEVLMHLLGFWILTVESGSGCGL